MQALDIITLLEKFSDAEHLTFILPLSESRFAEIEAPGIASPLISF